jgi:NADH-quinone oxidoreductase subunit J
MLLDLETERTRKFNVPAVVGGGAVLLGFVAILFKVLGSNAEFFGQFKPALTGPVTNDVKSVGLTLFTQFNLPFQIIGVLLLVATIGVVVLSKKELK